jgi:nucleotide-binding universal stress UspA family protein
MGAYGSAGMLRFLGLGGATGKVITACKVPVFLAR